MKKLIYGIFAVLLLCAFAAAPASAQATSTWDQIMKTKKLRLGAAPTEPWYYKDTTNSTAPGGVFSGGVMWRGVGVTLAKEIADAMGVELEVVETTWGNAVAGLQANQFDVMFMLDPNPVRGLALDFVSPVLWYPFGLIVRDDLPAKSWAELNDPKYKLGGVSGSSTDAILTRMAPKATIVRFQLHGEMLAAFQAGRIDGGMTTAPTADLTRAALKMGKTLVPTPVVALPSGAGMRRESDRRWRDYVELCVNYYYYSGKTQDMYEQFLSFRGLDPKEIIPIVRERLEK
jgi:polar amino acid transport system substrate-binding protein